MLFAIFLVVDVFVISFAFFKKKKKKMNKKVSSTSNQQPMFHNFQQNCLVGNNSVLAVAAFHIFPLS